MIWQKQKISADQNSQSNAAQRWAASGARIITPNAREKKRNSSTCTGRRKLRKWQSCYTLARGKKRPGRDRRSVGRTQRAELLKRRWRATYFRWWCGVRQLSWASAAGILPQSEPSRAIVYVAAKLLCRRITLIRQKRLDSNHNHTQASPRARERPTRKSLARKMSAPPRD
jgi:hypothetical protein